MSNVVESVGGHLPHQRQIYKTWTQKRCYLKIYIYIIISGNVSFLEARKLKNKHIAQKWKDGKCKKNPKWIKLWEYLLEKKWHPKPVWEEDSYKKCIWQKNMFSNAVLKREKNVLPKDKCFWAAFSDWQKYSPLLPRAKWRASTIAAAMKRYMFWFGHTLRESLMNSKMHSKTLIWELALFQLV